MTLPGHPTTVHINIYLPTAGRDAEYVSELSKLETALDEISAEYDDPIVIICGDANASIPMRQSNSRDILFHYFYNRMNLYPVLTNHKTYHHFMGEGSSDSSIDVILLKHSAIEISENIKKIICSKDDPRVDSKHDIIISQLTIPFICMQIPDPTPANDPPTIHNTKHRIIWSEQGILDYRELLANTLLDIQQNWKTPETPVS